MKLYIFLIIVALTACSETKNVKFHSSATVEGNSLQLIDSIKIMNTKDRMVGRIGRIGVNGDRFYITDYSSMRIHFYDHNFSFLKSIGRNGRGPGEFNYPMMFRNSQEILIMDISNHRITKFDNKFNYVEEYDLPKGYSYLYAEPIIINKNYIFSAEYPSDVTRDSYYKDFKSLICFNENFDYVCGAMEWTNVYSDPETKGAARCGTNTYTTLGPDNTFFSVQQSHWAISKISPDYSTQINFGKKPKYFRPLVKNIDFHQVQQSYDAIINMGSQESHVKNIYYDNESGYLVLSYNNPSKKAYSNQDPDFIDKYIIVYDNNLNCILETKVSGVFLFVKNGELFFLEEEKDKYIKINKYGISN